MGHVALPPNLPGISGAFRQFPATAAPMQALAQALLRGPSSLLPAERELLAAYISAKNNCVFCKLSHAATARALYGDDAAIVDQVLKDMDTAPLSPKLRALFRVADRVRTLAGPVDPADLAAARAAGADDQAIHDAVLVAAAFSMYNRYVEGLGTEQPVDEALYVAMGKNLAKVGYSR